MATYSHRIDATANAGIEDGGSVTLGGSAVRINEMDDYVGLWFPTVPAQQGATVNSATLTLNCPHPSGDDLIGTIYAEASDDAPAPAASTDDFSDRTPTSATVGVNETGEGAGSKTFNVATIIQELFSRAGWVENSDIFALVQGGSGVNWLIDMPENATADNRPQLDIDYTDPAGGTTIEASATDAMNLGEVTVRTRATHVSATDGLGLGGSPSPVATYVVSGSDGLYLAENPLVAAVFAALVEDDLQVGETAVRSLVATLSAIDGLVLGEGIAISAEIAGQATDGLQFGESLSLAALLAALAADGLTLSDVASGVLAGDLTAVAIDGLSFGEAAVSVMTKLAAVSDALRLGELPTALLLLLAGTADGLQLGETAAGSTLANLIEAITSDGLVLGETAGKAAVFNVSTTDTIQFAEITVRLTVFFITLSDGLRLGETAVYQQASGEVTITFSVAGRPTIQFNVSKPTITFSK